MSLSARERTRYARHLLLPEIGLGGQERLLATRVRLAESADPRAAQVARVYLERAGVGLVEAGENADEGVLSTQVWEPSVIEQVAGVPALEPAAAALAGALSAVETIKAALGLGTPRDSLAGVRLWPGQDLEERAAAREQGEKT